MSSTAILLQNGKIVDGQGSVSPAYVGDVLIENGHIVALSGRDGKNRLAAPKGARVVDCTNRLITPGWVDIHTHLDGQLTWDPMASPLSAGGTTTAVQGNCGVGFAPCKAQDRRFLMELMEGVEDIPLGALTQGLKWEWETFPEYLDSLSEKKLALDIGAMIGHGPVRAFVMGERANLSDKAGGPVANPVTPQDIEKMAAVVGEAIRAGAVGFSTSRTLLHRDRNGFLVPGTLAAEAELLAIGKAIGDNGRGRAIFEMASDFMCIDDVQYGPENHAERLKHFAREFLWMKKISQGFNVPLCFCLGIPSAMPEVAAYSYRAMLRQVAGSNMDGCNIKVQVFTRPQGVLMCWESRSHPFIESPAFDELYRRTKNKSTGKFDKATLLRDRTLRERIVQETLKQALAVEVNGGNPDPVGIQALPSSIEDEEESEGPGNFNMTVASVGALARMHRDNARNVFRWTSTYEPLPASSALAEAERRGEDVLYVIYDWLCEQAGEQVLTNMFVNYAHQSLDDCYEMLLNENTVPGVGDTGAHLGFLSDATSPTYLLTHWHRDRTSGPKIPLEVAVRLHTRNTAEVFGLRDRGTIQVGKLADINVVDLEKLEILCPEFVRDLPLGASRWVQSVKGYDMTIKSGVVTYEHGIPTGSLPGRLVRGGGYVDPKSPVKDAPASEPGMLSKVADWFRGVKWEGERRVIETLIDVVGPAKMEEIGAWVSLRMPLSEAKM